MTQFTARHQSSSTACDGNRPPTPPCLSSHCEYILLPIPHHQTHIRLPLPKIRRQPSWVCRGALIFNYLSPNGLGLGTCKEQLPFTGKHYLRVWENDSTLLARAVSLTGQQRARGEFVELGLLSELGLHEMDQLTS